MDAADAIRKAAKSRSALVEAERLHVTAGPGGPVLVFARTRPSPLVPQTTIQLGEAAAGERERLLEGVLAQMRGRRTLQRAAAEYQHELDQLRGRE